MIHANLSRSCCSSFFFVHFVLQSHRAIPFVKNGLHFRVNRRKGINFFFSCLFWSQSRGSIFDCTRKKRKNYKTNFCSATLLLSTRHSQSVPTAARRSGCAARRAHARGPARVICAIRTTILLQVAGAKHQCPGLGALGKKRRLEPRHQERIISISQLQRLQPCLSFPDIVALLSPSSRPFHLRM